MKLAAYVMLSDPEWLAASIGSYYDAVETILVSYDADGVGWTGHPLDLQPALDLIASLDRDRKCRMLAESYCRPGFEPIENDTRQRQCALDSLAAAGYDWVLQVDTDEVFPTIAPLPRLLDEAERIGAAAVEWPMRTYFQRLPNGSFLEVRGARGQAEYSYPGPVLIRAGEQVHLARRTHARTLRAAVVGDTTSPSLQPDSISPNVMVSTLMRHDEAIHHFSWVRSEAAMREKLSTWGHAREFDADRFYRKVWLAAPRHWRRMRNFHPLKGSWWPRLEAVNLELRSHGMSRPTSAIGAGSDRV